MAANLVLSLVAATVVLLVACRVDLTVSKSAVKLVGTNSELLA